MRWAIFFVCPALALIVPPSVIIASNLTLDGSSASTSAKNLSAPSPTSCNSAFYGSDPNLESCVDAAAKISRTTSSTIYGTRGQYGIESSLPIRYQSDDGFCVIELRPRKKGSSVRGDVARGVDIYDAAQHVIQKCMINSRYKSGGSTWGFSM